jgi:hypothetical protein
MSGDGSHSLCILEAIHLVLAHRGLNLRQCQYALLVIRWQMCQLLYKELEHCTKESDLRKVRYTFELMANHFG